MNASIVANGIAGFYSDIKIKEEQTYDSIVPDIPVENGSYIQDHIILKPVRIAIVGQIAPYHFKQQEDKFTSSISQAIDTLSVFLPKKTASQLQKVRNQVINVIDTVDSYISGFENILASFSGDKTVLMQVFNDFMIDIRNQKTPVDIQMPFQTHKNMIVTSFVLRTDNEANTLNYELTAKNIVIGVTKFTENVFKKGSEVENNGILEPKETKEFIAIP